MALQNRGHARCIPIPLQRERSGSDLDTSTLRCWFGRVLGGTAGMGTLRHGILSLPDIVGMIGAAPAQTKGPGFVYRGGLAQAVKNGKRNVSVLRTCDRFAFLASTAGGSDAGGLPT